MRMRFLATIDTCTGDKRRFPLVIFSSLMAIGLILPAVATAKPRITTQQILEKVKTAPGARNVPARVLGQSKKVVGTFDTIGKAPDGFGLTFNWNRADPQITLAVIVNSADPNGVALTNLEKGDVLRIASATGQASFTEGNGALIGGIVGVVGAALKIPFPQAKDLIDEGTKFAKEQFGQPNRDKVRDAVGREGIKIGGKRVTLLRRCEGGVLVTFPEAGGVYDSGEGCIKGKDDINGIRSDKRRPDHVTHGFFLTPGPGNHKIPTNGVVHLAAWDGPNDFADNQGFYLVIVEITRNDAVPPDDVVK